MASRREKARREIIRNEMERTALGRKNSRRERPGLQSETKHSIVSIFLFAIAVLVFLGLVGTAGAFGSAVNSLFTRLFGWGRWGVPFLLVWLAYVTFRPDRFALRAANYVGLFFLVIAATSLLHLTVSLSDVTAAVADGRGGGYVGLALSYPIRLLMGTFGSAVFLTALFLIGLLMFFDTSLDRLTGWTGIFRRLIHPFRSGFGRVQEHLEKTPEEAEPEPRPSPFLVKDLPKPVETAEDAAPVATKPEEQLAMFPDVKRRRRARIEIPLDLLEANHSKPTAGDIKDQQEKIRKTLENFGIPVEMGDVKVGPTVTQYTLKPAEGVKLATITTLSNDLALALAAHPIRIEAPIPGKSLVGIEVPNAKVAIVRLRQILESEAFAKRSSTLTFALGADVAGTPHVADMEPMPHLLIAGATGSGKSVCLNSIIVSLLFENSPDDLKLILVDPKRVEMTVYNDVPHLLTPVITEVDKTINALRWLVAEMDRRFHLLSKAGKRNIQQYNANGGDESLPFIVLVVDELADLMAVAAREVEATIIRLAQMARAVGIHLVLATQRPSVDVITGLIKANITSRIAFSVASAVDSRTILDTSGAEKLLGRGDMLYLTPQLSKPKRIQGCFVSDAEIERLSAYLKERAKPDYSEGVTEKPAAGVLEGDFAAASDDDELLGEAKDVILRAGKASASLLQRRLRVGYARAARLLDLLEERGIIGPGEGAKPRDILISRQGYEGSEASFSDAESEDESAVAPSPPSEREES